MNLDSGEDRDDSEVDEIDIRELRFLGRFLRRFFRRYHAPGLGLAIVLLAETGFNCGFPLATRHLIDDGLLGRDERALVTMLIFLAIAAVSVSVLGLIGDYLAARITSGMVGDIRLSLFEHLQTLPLATYTRTPAGALLSRFSGDLVGLEGALVSLISWLVSPALEVVYATCLMF